MSEDGGSVERLSGADSARLVPMYRPETGSGSPTARLSDEAYRRIREMLMSGEIPPASRIREATIAKELGVSRTPVRDGLRRLEAEGLIKEVPHRGYVVIEVGPEDLKDIYRVRSVLEGLAAEQAAARAGRTDLAVLEDLMEAMAREVESGDGVELALLNREFHKAVARASRNTYLVAMLDEVNVISHRFRRAAIALPARRQEAHHEHEELLAVLRERNGERARRLAGAHATRALDTRLGIGGTHAEGEEMSGAAASGDHDAD